MRSKKKNSPTTQRSPLTMGVGAGLGAGLLGAAFLAIRSGWRKQRRTPLSEAISPAVFATRVLNTSSGEIVYHTSGKGAPLLFLHAVFPGSSSFEWSKVYPHFANNYHVFVPDLIGFGESQRPSPALSQEAQVRSLVEFLESTTPDQPVTIVASGLTANLALLLSSRYPQRISRLLLWMPLLALKETKQSLPFLASTLGYFPSLARTLYRRQLSTEASIRNWLLRSEFSPEDPSFHEALTVLTSTAQLYGAEHAFLAQSSRKFWHHFSQQLSPLTIPITLLTSQEKNYQTSETITCLRSLTNRFSFLEIDSPSTLAPLTNTGSVIAAIEHELTRA